MTTIYAKSQALNVWSSQTGTDNLRVDMTAGYMAGSYESRIAHVNSAGTLQPVQFPGPLVFFDGSARHVLADRFVDVEQAISDLSNSASGDSSAVAADLATERKRAEAAEGVNAAAVVSENGRALSAESFLFDGIAQEIQDRASAESDLSNRINNEATARAAADTVHTDALIAANGRVTAEATAARAAELLNANSIIAEGTRALSAEGVIDARVTQVRTYLLDRQNSLFTHVNNINTITIPAEATRALAAETSLQGQISSLLANTDGVALNSLAELVADYRLNGTTVTSSLDAAVARIDALEAMVAALQAVPVD